MLAFLTLLPLVAPFDAIAADPLANPRKKIETLAAALAKDGQADAAVICLEQHAELGATERQRERLAERVEKALTKAAGKEPKASSLAKHAKAATKIAELLTKASDSLNEPEASLALESAMRFDAQLDALREELGHVRGSDGLWRDPVGAACRDRRREMLVQLQRARGLDVEVEMSEAADPTLVAWARANGRPLSAGRADNVYVESTVEPGRLQETLRTLHRSLAWSNWIVNGELAATNNPVYEIQLGSRVDYDSLADAFLDAGRITAEEHAQSRGMAGFYCANERSPQGAPLFVVHGTQLQLLSGALLVYDDALGMGHAREGDVAPPIWAQVGLANFVALSFLGASIPEMAIREAPDGRTRSKPKRLELKLPNAGLVGCRSWLRELVRQDRDPSLASCMLDAPGKVTGDLLLKATCVVEFLLERGDLVDRLDAYRDWTAREPGPPVQRWERAVEVLLPEFEAAWRRWLFGGDPRSVRGLLESAGSSAATKEALAVLEELNQVRAKAGLEPVELDASLSLGAQRHAEYLRLHPEQTTKWPDAHEEYPESVGFTPEGAWGGAHSVISFVGFEGCIDDWMGTFYHRLPLVHPGLLRIGFGSDGAICVLDSTSVVDPTGDFVSHYPFDGMEGVPLRFNPELPNPVPERADQSSLGYPITLQIGSWLESPHVEMKLTRRSDPAPVPCILSTPNAPSNPELAPDGAYALIPEAPLQPKTDYRVEITLPDRKVEFVFRTGR